MACTHERIKSVNCVLFCDICGEKLPSDFFAMKKTPKEEKAGETPAEAQETAPKKTARKRAEK